MKRILLIEDDRFIRDNLTEALQLEGYCVQAHSNAIDGLRSARQEPPDLILCDIMMPGMDGHGLLRELRSERRTARVPFIFLTARGTLSDLRQGMDLGANDYLIKPVKPSDLLLTVRSRLERHAEQHVGGEPVFDSPERLKPLGLSPRETEVLFWVAQGKTNEEAGLILNLSRATVKKHLENIFRKTGTENRASASLKALEILSSG